MSKYDERKIKVFFEQLRQEEEKTAPAFQQVLWGEKTSRRSIGWGFRLRPAVAVFLALLVAGPVIYQSLRQAPAPEVEMAVEFEEWESPTDFLLSFNDSSFDSGLPEIGTTFWEEYDIRSLEN